MSRRSKNKKTDRKKTKKIEKKPASPVVIEVDPRLKKPEMEPQVHEWCVRSGLEILVDTDDEQEARSTYNQASLGLGTSPDGWVGGGIALYRNGSLYEAITNM